MIIEISKKNTHYIQSINLNNYVILYAASISILSRVCNKEYTYRTYTVPLKQGLLGRPRRRIQAGFAPGG